METDSQIAKTKITVSFSNFAKRP